MAVKEFRIRGYRGFSRWTSFKPSIPNGKPGSGLTLLVGANNAGKTSLLEAMSWFAAGGLPSVTEKQRNKTAGDRIGSSMLFDDLPDAFEVESIKAKSSELRWKDPGQPPAGTLFFVPARRAFGHSFDKGVMERQAYSRQVTSTGLRDMAANQFTSRLFRIHEDEDRRIAFGRLLSGALGTEIDWTIDMNENRQHYVRISTGNHSYTSEGLGQGIISLMYVIDSLYDSEPGHTILIDEPELSLQPNVIRRLCSLVREYAKDRQIVLATHSPYFVDWKALVNGGQLVRLTGNPGRKGTELHALSRAALRAVPGILRDTHHPHTLDLLGREVFFQDDGVLLVEGQEDVVYFERVLADLDLQVDGWFFGWGVGGAGKMKDICHMLVDLGFKKVVGILDNNVKNECSKLRRQFPDFRFELLPASDIRFKESQPSRPELDGVWKKGSVQVHLREPMKEMIHRVNTYLASE